MAHKVRKVKVARKKIQTKASVIAKVTVLEGNLAWATRIIQTQQGEIDRLIKINDSLTKSLENLSRRD